MTNDISFVPFLTKVEVTIHVLHMSLFGGTQIESWI